MLIYCSNYCILIQQRIFRKYVKSHNSHPCFQIETADWQVLCLTALDCALNFVTWAGIFMVCGLYHIIFTLEKYSFSVAIQWLPKYLLGGILMFFTISPFCFRCRKNKGICGSCHWFSRYRYGSAALANHDWELSIRGQLSFSWCRVKSTATVISLLCL